MTVNEMETLELLKKRINVYAGWAAGQYVNLTRWNTIEDALRIIGQFDYMLNDVENTLELLLQAVPCDDEKPSGDQEAETDTAEVQA